MEPDARQNKLGHSVSKPTPSPRGALATPGPMRAGTQSTHRHAIKFTLNEELDRSVC